MNKTLLKSTFSALALAVIISVTGCKKKSDTTTPDTAPTVATANIISNVTSTTAQSGGITTYNGGETVTVNGVCWSTTNQTPTVADSKTSDTVNTTTFAFNSTAKGLTANTTYYLRAYATNSVGTGYGSVIKFTTNSEAGGLQAAVTTFAGQQTPGFSNGSAASALFNSPQGVYADASGNVYVSDTFNSAMRLISGGSVTTLAGNGTIGYTDAAGTNAEFYGPQGIVKDASGNVYVADEGNNVIRKITPDGTVSTFAGNGISGYVNGSPKYAEFRGPRGLAIDSKGNIYVADRGNSAIRKISPAGNTTLYVGYAKTGYNNATQDTTTGVYAYFNKPNAVAVDASGNLYVADQGNYAIRKVTPGLVVTTIAGSPTLQNVVGSPAGMAIDSKGNLFITDENGRVFELTSDNVLYSIAGSFGVADFANGTGTAAKFNAPQGIAVDNSGNIYVADFNNNCIRKLVMVAPN